MAFGGAVLLIALSLAAVLLHHWQRRSDERRANERLSELGDHLLKDIGLSRADVVFAAFAKLEGRNMAALLDHRRRRVT